MHVSAVCHRLTFAADTRLTRHCMQTGEWARTCVDVSLLNTKLGFHVRAGSEYIVRPSVGGVKSSRANLLQRAVVRGIDTAAERRLESLFLLQQQRPLVLRVLALLIAHAVRCFFLAVLLAFLQGSDLR